MDYKWICLAISIALSSLFISMNFDKLRQPTKYESYNKAYEYCDGYLKKTRQESCKSEIKEFYFSQNM